MKNDKKALMTRKLFEWNIIIIAIIALIGILGSLRFEENGVSFDDLTLQITLIICSLFEVMLLVRIYPIMKEALKEEENKK